MSTALMAVFDKYIMPATIETLGQEIDKFNAASGGAIVLSSAGFEGDFRQQSFWNAVHSAQRRVDRYAAQGAAPVTDMSQVKEASVKVAGGFGPLRWEPSQLTWLLKPTTEAVAVASQNFAEAMLADMLNSALAAVCGAIGNVPALVNNVAPGAPLSQAAMNGAHAKFGDKSPLLRTSFMTGAAFHFLLGSNLTNAEQLYVAGNVRVIDILGKLIVVTDAPALTVAATYRVPTLVEGAVIVSDAGDLISNIETTNGQTRIETTMQADYSFGIGLKGFSWDTVNGGKSPTDAELATGTNWDKTVADNKHTAGVMTIGANA
jgi:Major capsid protein 13-like